MRYLVIAAICSALATSGQAQEFVLGVGATDYAERGDDSVAFDFDYLHRPFYEGNLASISLAANLGVTGEGDFFVGAGLASQWQWDSGWFVEGSLMPGFYEEGTPGNDLGQTLEFRSLLGIGYRFDNGTALSAAISHKSNAGLDDSNPGMNTYSIRYHFPF